jgi:hypothetical protein
MPENFEEDVVGEERERHNGCGGGSTLKAVRAQPTNDLNVKCGVWTCCEDVAESARRDLSVHLSARYAQPRLSSLDWRRYRTHLRSGVSIVE